MPFMAASEEKLQMKLCRWGSILTSRKKKKNQNQTKNNETKKTLQIKYWDVIKPTHLKAAFLPHKTNKETAS